MAPQPHHHQPGVRLAVRGAVPPGLSGRLTAVGDGLIHSVDLHGGRATHVVRPIRTPGAVRDLCAVDGSVLAFTDDGVVTDLYPTGPSPRLDLAGRGQVPVTSPTLDPITGELHLISRDAVGDHAHVAISAGRLTRRSRRIERVPGDIRGIALTRGHLVVVADGAIGILPRIGDGPALWAPTGTAAPAPVHAYDTDGDVELVVLAPPLERWILHPDGTAVSREILDPAPKLFARCSAAGDVPTSVWTAGGHTVTRHDLRGPRAIERNVAPNAPGDFVLVPGDARSPAAHSWFVGLVHETASRTTQVHVIGADDPAMQPVASFRLPQRLPLGSRSTWTSHPPTSHPTDEHHPQEHPS